MNGVGWLSWAGICALVSDRDDFGRTVAIGMGHE
jgi:hypothetical protein